LETHQPLKGITVGDIGPKYCFHSSNNGFLAFDNVRIPLNQMLMKNSKILENGEFIVEKNPLLTYANMTKVRVGIVRDASFLIALAATIATRYSLIRMQSTIETDKEVQILNHLTQQNKIFPAITLVFAIKCASEDLQKFYEKSIVEIEKGNLNSLAELHALSCCLKAVSTTDGTRAIECCRLACGGHGYLNSAGFNTVLETITAAQTYEGENTVLLLQTGRFLLKAFQQFLNNENIPSTLSYFENSSCKKFIDGSPENFLEIIQKTSLEITSKAFEHYKMRGADGKARNEIGVELVETSKLYGITFIMSSLIKFVRNSPENLNEIMENILDIYCCDIILKNLGNILQFNILCSNDIEKIQMKYENSLKKFRFNAIGVVDAFDIHDYMLNSTLGSYDGDVYEKIIEKAKKSTLNQEIVNKTYFEFVKPLMKSSL
jgi:acyl-CoA oxidase